MTARHITRVLVGIALVVPVALTAQSPQVAPSQPTATSAPVSIIPVSAERTRVTIQDPAGKIDLFVVEASEVKLIQESSGLKLVASQGTVRNLDGASRQFGSFIAWFRPGGALARVSVSDSVQ